MPITKATGYKASDGIVYGDVEMAQRAELKLIFKGSDGVGGDYTPEEAITDILTYRDQLIEILTTGPKSRPGARKRAGTTQPRRAAKPLQNLGKALSKGLETGQMVPASGEQAKAGFKAMREAVTTEEKAHVEDVTGRSFQGAKAV